MPAITFILIQHPLRPLLATLGLFMMGMFVGWSSAVLATLRSPDSEVRLSDAQLSWTVSVLYIGSTLSPVPTGWLMDVLGRKYTLMLLASTAIASWAILVLIQDPTGIYVARYITVLFKLLIIDVILTIITIRYCLFICGLIPPKLLNRFQ